MKNQKKTVVDQGKRILLKYHHDVGGAACYFCGEFVEDDGLDFFVEGTDKFRVCAACVGKKAPDLYLIHEYAHNWQEEALEKEYFRGVESGKTAAGQMILDAITESEIERVKRVCRVELGAKACDDIPF